MAYVPSTSLIRSVTLHRYCRQCSSRQYRLLRLEWFASWNAGLELLPQPILLMDATIKPRVLRIILKYQTLFSLDSILYFCLWISQTQKEIESWLSISWRYIITKERGKLSKIRHPSRPNSTLQSSIKTIYHYPRNMLKYAKLSNKLTVSKRLRNIWIT